MAESSNNEAHVERKLFDCTELSDECDENSREFEVNTDQDANSLSEQDESSLSNLDECESDDQSVLQHNVNASLPPETMLQTTPQQLGRKSESDDQSILQHKVNSTRTSETTPQTTSRLLWRKSESNDQSILKHNVNTTLTPETAPQTTPQQLWRKSQSDDQSILQLKVNATRTPETPPQTTPKQLWRKRSLTNYVKTERKRRRNEGKDYFSEHTKKRIKGRVLGPPCTCREKCRSKLVGTETKIFEDFWNLASFDLQNSYLFDCIKTLPKKRSYPKKTKKQESRRNFTTEYNVKVNGEYIKLCKIEFMNVHGLQKSRGRLDNIISSISSGATSPKLDQRGKHDSRPNKITEERLESVRAHITGVLKYQSHYSRSVIHGKLLLGCDLSISRLYEDFYLPWCSQSSIKNPVTQAAYRRVFCTEFNIGFRLPNSDTYKTCDEANSKIEALQLQGKQDETKVTETAGASSDKDKDYAGAVKNRIPAQ